MFQFHFGQVCVYMGSDAQEHARLCRLLQQQGIWFDLAEGDSRADAARRRAGLGERPELPRLHRIYVKSRDADRSRELIRQEKQRQSSRDM